jgi:hypothetical protein
MCISLPKAFTRLLAPCLFFLLLLLVSAGSASAAPSAWWKLVTTSSPTVMTPGGEATIVVEASNLGDAPAAASAAPIDVAVKLPSWFTPNPNGVNAAAGPVKHVPNGTGVGEGLLGTPTCVTSQAPPVVRCSYAESPLPAFEMIEVFVRGTVSAGAPASGLSEATIEGGETPSASSTQTLKTGVATPFGVERNELVLENEGGTPDTQAGSHPFQLTSTIGLNEETAPEPDSLFRVGITPELPKDLNVKLPPGLVANANLIPQCTEEEFTAITKGGINFCGADTAIGVALISFDEPRHISYRTLPVPIFNLTPAPGEPARFGFEVESQPVVLDTSVRTGSDNGATVSVNNITELATFLKSETVFWGVPGEASHDSSRGWSCVAGKLYVEYHEAPEEPCDGHEAVPKAFLTLPTSCPTNPATGLPEPLQSSAEIDSWEEPGVFGEPVSSTTLGLDGCGRVPFEPSLKVTPDGTAGSSPTGLTVDVHNPQEETVNAKGLAEADPRTITVALPEGMALNPAGGDGLGACTGDPGIAPETSGNEIGFKGFGEFGGARTALFTPTLPGSIGSIAAGEKSSLEQGVNFCADASRIGTVDIASPLLPTTQHLKGSVYLATQNANPFGSLVAIYIVAEDPVSGVLVKLTGEVQLSATGQIVTTLENNPQLPFEDAEIHFFGGERAPLATPAHCGDYTSTSSMTAWSGGAPATPSSTFAITSGPNGSACPGASLPFSPSLHAGSSNVQAGAFSSFTTTISREDGNQNMASVTLHMPPGLSGLLSSVKLCPEAQANAGSCSPESLIGETIVSAGVGSDPVSVTGGKVYITEKYHGAPFGLSIVNPVKAGPFDLEHDTANPNQDPACDCIVVRAKIEVDPHTAALTVTTNSESEGYAIPHLIDGIPVQIKDVDVTINRSGFTFNPTNCNKLGINANISSDENASSSTSAVFRVTNCAALKFEPKFSVSTSGKTSKAKGASLTATLSEPAGSMGTQANITRAKFDLPKQLPSRLTTLQKACTNKQFELNPANCPKESKIGYAVVHTPLLPVPLEGPAIFVSHGGEAFPSLTMVLQGYGVTVDLVGTTFISKKGITSTTFKTVPDVPFNAFQLTLPQGKFSALAANGNLCKSKLAMPTEFLAQNGAKINESTKISVASCPKAHKAAKKHKSKKQGKK